MAKQSKVFAIRVVAGREKNVASILEAKAINALNKGAPTVKSIIVIDQIRGYVFVESEDPIIVNQMARGIAYVKGFVYGTVNLEEIEQYLKLTPKEVEFEVGEEVEIIKGPFRGLRGRVTKVEAGKNRVVIELLDSAFRLPVTLYKDMIKKVT